jgi:hypothetical protein
LGPTSFIDLSVRFARAQYATSPFNSNRLLGNFAWGRQLSGRSSVSLNADTERVMFDNTAVNTDFDRTSGFGRYEVHGARTDILADLGATTINRSGSSTSGGLGRIQLTRRLSRAAWLTLSVGHDLTDAATSFSNLQGGAIGVVGTAPAALTSNSYTTNYVSAGWQYEHDRTVLALSGRWDKNTYGGQPLLDSTRSGAEFRVVRILTRALSAEIFGRYFKTNYPQSNLAPGSGSANFDDELIAGILTWRHGRGLEIKLKCEHDARLATGIFGYRENRAVLTVGYRPRTLQTEFPMNNPTNRNFPANTNK